MKIQKPKIPKGLPEIFDMIELLQEARENETEIEEIHIKSSYLVGEDMKGLRFSNVLFENVRLMECDLQKCSFIDVVFKNCDLSNCDMSQGYFNRCEFITDKAIGLKLTKTIMKDVAIIESNLEYANLTGISMNAAELINSNFGSASITECKLKNITCDQAEFINTNFFKTPLKGIDFTKSTLIGIIVSNEGTELKGAIVDLYQAAEIAKLLGIVIR